jgi:zinc-ribbon domain
MICSRCHTVNVAGAQFCAHCGASLTGAVSEELITAKVEPAIVSVPPGGHAKLTVSVRNDTRVVEHVGLGVDAPDGGWVSVMPPELRMMPGASSAAVLQLEPPRSATLAAGLHPLRVAVRRSGSGELLAYADGRVQLGAFYAVSAQVIPRDGAAWLASRRRVWIDNSANAEVAVRLSGSDPDEAVVFRGVDGPITIPPGTNISRSIVVRARRPNTRLHRKPQEFTVAVSWGDQQRVVASGVLIQRAFVILVVLSLLAIAVVAVIAASH